VTEDSDMWWWHVYERVSWFSVVVSLVVLTVSCWVIKKLRERSESELQRDFLGILREGTCYFYEAPVHRPCEGNVRQIPSGRMRKRDLVGYYGRRMIRKASTC